MSSGSSSWATVCFISLSFVSLSVSLSLFSLCVCLPLAVSGCLCSMLARRVVLSRGSAGTARRDLSWSGKASSKPQAVVFCLFFLSLAFSVCIFLDISLSYFLVLSSSAFLAFVPTHYAMHAGLHMEATYPLPRAAGRKGKERQGILFFSSCRRSVPPSNRITTPLLFRSI